MRVDFSRPIDKENPKTRLGVSKKNDTLLKVFFTFLQNLTNNENKNNATRGVGLGTIKLSYYRK